MLDSGTPWTPRIKKQLTEKFKRQVILPPVVDWMKLAEEVKKEEPKQEIGMEGDRLTTSTARKNKDRAA